MAYCKKCGAELREGAAFCHVCGAPVEGFQTPPAEARKPVAQVAEQAPPPASGVEPPPAQRAPQAPGQGVIDLAGWGERIIAYIIDAIIVGVVAGLIKAVIFIPSFFWAGMMGYPQMRWMPWMDLGPDNLLYFIYFLWMDLSYGQSVGKMVMRIRVTNLDGGRMNLTQAAIEVFGKAFLLPLDVIIGWFFLGEKSQRLFTFLAQTIVVKDRK
jgi:uncharacterized RDD family membrane protein YckC